jgi:hypothetical protein
MARTFTRASSNRINLGTGVGVTLGGSWMAFIARKATDPAAYAVPFSFGDQDSSAWFIWTQASTDLKVWNGATDTAAPFGWAATDGWCLIAATKASGTTVIRFHKYVFSTNTWTHSNSSSTAADKTPTGGALLGTEQDAQTPTYNGFFDGDIAIAGAGQTNATDDQVEALAFSLASWHAITPKVLVLLDQSATGQKVVDLAGNGFNESAINGTAVASSSVPVFNYGNGIWTPTLPKGVTQREASGSAAVTTSATGAATVTSLPSGSSAVATAATGAGTVKTLSAGSSAVTTSSTGAATAKTEATGAAAVVTSSTGAATVTVLPSATAAVTVGAAGAPTVPVSVSGTASVTVTAAGEASVQVEGAGSSAVSVTGAGVATVQIGTSGTSAIIVAATGFGTTPGEVSVAATVPIVTSSTGAATVPVGPSALAAIVTASVGTGTVTVRPSGASSIVITATGTGGAGAIDHSTRAPAWAGSVAGAAGGSVAGSPAGGVSAAPGGILGR